MLMGNRHIGLEIAKSDINFKIQFELDKHLDINLINMFCKVTIRGIWRYRVSCPFIFILITCIVHNHL